MREEITLQGFTMSHRSPFCMCWDIWTSIAIGYDMVPQLKHGFQHSRACAFRSVPGLGDDPDGCLSH